MTAAVLVLLFVTIERLAEVGWSAANARRLVAAGGYEVGAGHYPVMVALHVAFLATLWGQAATASVRPEWLALFGLLQVFRAWIMVTLGRRWTTRILVVPGERLVRSGPYRYLRHPNYAVVAAEIAVLPLVFGLTETAVLFTLLNTAVLAVRIRAEDAALAPARGER
jgi:methyltransferase